MNVPELLAPAGSPERLKSAILFGADAVYLSGKHFGLRAQAENFTTEELAEGIAYAHDRGKRCYVTLNKIPRQRDLGGLQAAIEEARDTKADAVIVSDPGIMREVQRLAPGLPIHLSTQANATNAPSCKFWYDQGVRRIVFARELSFQEMGEIIAAAPKDLEFECFIHGSMCISYSGRCLMSNYFSSRDGNSGACAQPCRWKYAVMEEKRPGEYFPVAEDAYGTYIFNSKDLFWMPHIKELAEIGMHCFKIEGRMKTAYYTATVTRAYRRALDRYSADPEHFRMTEEDQAEVMKAGQREFTDAFYEGPLEKNSQLYDRSRNTASYEFSAMVLDYDESGKRVFLQQRNNFRVGDRLEALAYHELPREDFVVERMADGEGNEILVAPHPMQKVWVDCDLPLMPGDMLRKYKKS